MARMSDYMILKLPNQIALNANQLNFFIFLKNNIIYILHINFNTPKSDFKSDSLKVSLKD